MATGTQTAGAVLGELRPGRPVDDGPRVDDDRQQAVMSVLLVGHRSLAAQRRGRYVSGSVAHRDRMAPDLAATLIRAYSDPGDLVFDPLAGVGTTLIEAVHAGRDACGVDCDPGWVALARANLRLARRRGAAGWARMLHADATRLPRSVFGPLRGRVDLVLTAPPSGVPMTGQTEPRRTSRTLASRSQQRVDLIDGITAVLTGCADLLKPGGLIVVVTRQRDSAHLNLSEQFASSVGETLTLADHRYAAHARLRDGKLVAHSTRRHVTTGGVNSSAPAAAVGYDDITIWRRTTTRVPGRHR